MNKLVPFSKFSKLNGKLSFLNNASVVLDKDNTPVGYVLGRETFISFLELIDEEFEKRAKDSQESAANPAGKLIDAIEAQLPLSDSFIKDLKNAQKEKGWIPIEEVAASLHA